MDFDLRVHGFTDAVISENLLDLSDKLPHWSKIPFSIEKKKVNHVGILINDTIFLHSPGRNKAVKTDKINSTYWLKYYRGIGRVIKCD